MPSHEEPTPAEPPAIPGHRILGWLGGGGFATVWRATRIDDGEPVAIKLGRVGTELIRARFEREARALSMVGPVHAPALYEHGVLDGGRPYLVMELLTGVLLSEELGRFSKPPPLHWTRDVADAVLASLEAVHAQQLIHRDLKPDNIFLYRRPRLHVRLVDFGIAKATSIGLPYDDSSLTRAGTLIGTLEYMAPEQLSEDGVVDARTDIYAAGVLLYELLTLRVPFTGDARAIERGHRQMRPRRPEEFADIPAAIGDVCLGCLAKNADKRPRSVTALRETLAKVFSEADLSKSARRPSQSQTSLLSDGQQPVVLLAAEVATTDSGVAEVIRRRKGTIARRQGRSYVCGFSGLHDADPAEAAISAARALVETYRARVVLHLARVKVRRGRGRRPAKMYGPAVSEPKDWMPERGWRNILVTERLAGVLPADQIRPAPNRPGFFELVIESAGTPRSDEPRLVGRGDVIGLAGRSLREVLASSSPGLLTLIGGSGMGKSRIARELEEMTADLCPEAKVIALRASKATHARPDETLCRLLAVLAQSARSLEKPADESASTSQKQIHSGGSDGAGRLAEGLRGIARAHPLVVILDDAHYADGETLDGLEYATLSDVGIRLWVVVLAHPRLRRRRPRWGRRAHRHHFTELAPLDREAARELAAELLRPVEYPPATTLERIAQWTGGSPHLIGQLVRTLKQEGIVRKRPQTGIWYVATADLDRLPPSPSGQWLAARQLGTLRPELAACIRMCAVLGTEFLRDELEWVQNAAERTGTATTSMDTDVGLAELARCGFLATEGDGVWTFPQAAFQDAIYKLLGTKDRQSIHAAALEFWRAQLDRYDPERVLGAIARHAGASGEPTAAADAYLQLGDHERQHHHDVDADQHYSAALPLIAESDHARLCRLLMGRGEARYRMQRMDEALGDLRAGKEHAAQLGDDGLLGSFLLEEATALDWAGDFSAAQKRVAEAEALVRSSADPALEARYLLALGRCRFREEDMQEACDLLERAAGLAALQGNTRTRIVALLLLGPTLVCTERLADAEACFAEVISLCQKVGDRLHLCVAYSNRSYLWAAKRSLAGSAEDLRSVLLLARELGLAIAEHAAAHNLAEFLHWSGEHTEALTLIRRARALQHFMPDAERKNTLLLARIQAARGDMKAVREAVDDVRKNPKPLSHSDELALGMLELMLESSPDEELGSRWDDLLSDAASTLPGAEILEILYFHSLTEIRMNRLDSAAELVSRAQGRLLDIPIWRKSFASLAEQIAGARG